MLGVVLISDGLFLDPEILHHPQTWNDIYFGAAPSVGFGSDSSPVELCCSKVRMKEPAMC